MNKTNGYMVQCCVKSCRHNQISLSSSTHQVNLTRTYNSRTHNSMITFTFSLYIENRMVLLIMKTKISLRNRKSHEIVSPNFVMYWGNQTLMTQTSGYNRQESFRDQNNPIKMFKINKMLFLANERKVASKLKQIMCGLCMYVGTVSWFIIKMTFNANPRKMTKITRNG